MFTAFLQIENIPGESTDKEHSNWIELTDFNIEGLQQQAGSSGSRGGALSSGRSEMKPFRVRKLVDKATPKIFEACMKGTHISKITLSVARQTGSSGGPTEFFNYEIQNAMVVGFDAYGKKDGEGTDTGDASALPEEEVSFVGVSHKMKYTETDIKGGKKGNTEAQYDLSKNT